uniref:Uncharacterized protein LOC108053952 n=1 Tax=Drosophila rhopaloa TaxID=1041015 RepID=A0A6P4FRS6_DRORH
MSVSWIVLAKTNHNVAQQTELGEDFIVVIETQLGGASAPAESDRKMIKLRPYVPSKRIAIRDSSIDEDASDYVEDEVLIKDARSAK